ncbi:hypothetical protein I203_103021 [Kwoniella mangroviensis CBS 8507]|uniref:uncharacterized protein n=1 Tax=Kwoniella mangroviensis CBS 8507 TaxID=1296122 RepID=UPI00080D5B30|nr:uncharacterized protein I203_03998 [Kwoniella mangroviensis CBS 8507]OCF67308.1 hypothetical protein I203_03998 [Kwoniella mangroviensis CBS 8507]
MGVTSENFTVKISVISRKEPPIPPNQSWLKISSATKVDFASLPEHESTVSGYGTEKRYDARERQKRWHGYIREIESALTSATEQQISTSAEGTNTSTFESPVPSRTVEEDKQATKQILGEIVNKFGKEWTLSETQALSASSSETVWCSTGRH